MTANASNKAEFDQAMAEVAESYPPMLYRFYANLKSEGFDGDAALSLTLALLTSIVGLSKKE